MIIMYDESMTLLYLDHISVSTRLEMTTALRAHRISTNVIFLGGPREQAEAEHSLPWSLEP